MSFFNPAGLWGLLGIPVLILIYIIKPKFQEKVVTSTFIWKLSRKYKKKSLPWQITNTILFLVQLLIIGAISLILARPVVLTEDGAAEKIVILDASASMMVEGEEGCRFEIAKARIEELADKMESYGKMTVILAGTKSRLLAERLDSEREIKALVQNAKCTYGEADLNGAFLLAEEVLKENSKAQVYLVTDKAYGETSGLRVINVAEEAWNVAVCSVEASRAENRELVFSAKLASYGKDAAVTVVLYVDDVLADAQLVGLLSDVPANVEFSGLGIRQYENAKIYVEAADALAEDNEYCLFENKSESYEVLLVSEEPTFLEAALMTLDQISVTTVGSLEELDQGERYLPDGTLLEEIPSTGYDLYVYDGVMPKTLPGDGAVWMLNPEKVPKGVTFKLGKTVAADAYLETAPDSGSALFAALTHEVSVNEVYLNEYLEISSALGFETIYTCNDAPVILAGEADNVRAVIFGFDLNASNLPLRIAFPELIYNMVQYSLCPVLEETTYEVGDEVTLNKVSGAVITTVKGTGQMAGAESYVRMPAIYVAEEPGRYTVTQIMADESVEEHGYFVHLAEGESNLTAAGGTLPELTGGSETVTYEKEITWWIVAALLILIVLEWGLQYREQF